MRLYKKSDNILTCKLNDEIKIIACKNDIQLIKSDIAIFNNIIKPSILSIIKEYDYVILFGYGYNCKLIGFNDYDTFIESCKIKPFIGGVLQQKDIEVINNITN